MSGIGDLLVALEIANGQTRAVVVGLLFLQSAFVAVAAETDVAGPAGRDTAVVAERTVVAAEKTAVVAEKTAVVDERTAAVDGTAVADYGDTVRRMLLVLSYSEAVPR